jgi:HEAT repeats
LAKIEVAGLGEIMRDLIVITLVIFVTHTPVWAQQAHGHKATRAELLTQLRSDDVEKRIEAYKQLKSDRAALQDPKVKAAFVDLLDRENQGQTSGEEEDYSEYVSSLTDTVARTVDWRDTHQVCVLANSVDPPKELSDHAKVAVPCLLQKLQSSSAIARGATVASLVQALAKGKSELSTEINQTVTQIILSALRDPDETVKIPTVKALGQFGGEDMIPALRVVAETDPDPAENYAIRKWAAEAIAAIQQRAGQK